MIAIHPEQIAFRRKLLSPFGAHDMMSATIKLPLQESMMIGFLLWLLLCVVCWPLALMALVLYPLIWLILLPFRLIGITVDAVFELLRAIVLLPARVLRGKH